MFSQSQNCFFHHEKTGVYTQFIVELQDQITLLLFFFNLSGHFIFYSLTFGDIYLFFRDKTCPNPIRVKWSFLSGVYYVGNLPGTYQTYSL